MEPHDYRGVHTDRGFTAFIAVVTVMLILLLAVSCGTLAPC